jgi:DHA2 family multidrug resistance protein
LLVAKGLIASVVSQQSLTLAFDDVFRLMTWMFVAALLMVPFCKPSPASGRATPVDAH